MELYLAIAGILITLLLWLISPESLRRWIRQLPVWLFRSHPAAAAQPDLAMFDGRVQLLTEHLFSRPADAARKSQYYEAEGPLDWDIIAAQADVERDQQADVMKLLNRPVDSLRFICLLGESGIGKSTLAWRVAAELFRRHQSLVLQVRGWDAPEVWYRMPEFCSMVRRPIVVLADDLFRDPAVRVALQQLSPWLPMAVLATSQTHEYRPERLKGEVVPIPIKTVTSEERTRALVLLGKDPSHRDRNQSTRLMVADDFLVLMAGLTSGKGFQSIVQESLDNLARQHPLVYRAYEYVCFAYSYGIAVPMSLVERLDSQSSFHDLPNREGARGLIFCDEAHPGCVRPGHRRRAELASTLFQRNRPPTNVLDELVRAADASAPLQRRFVADILRSVTLKNGRIVEEILPRIQEQVATCVRQSSTMSELALWRAFYLGVGRSEEAEGLVDVALALKPVTFQDVDSAVYLLRERGREADALPILQRWVQAEGEWGGGGPAFLGLVEKFGTETDLARAIRDTGAWLVPHPDDNYVRPAYVGLVGRKGTAEQTERVLQETAAWLGTHPDDKNVRAVYLGLVERKGTAEQTEHVLQQTAAWLATHPDDNYVRPAYVGLVERKGTAEQTERMLQETAAWLGTHPDDKNVRTAYLGLVERKGTAEQAERVLQETAAWLRTHPNATDVWMRFFSYLMASERFDAARALAEEVVTMHSANSNLVTHYLHLVQDQLEEARIRELYESLFKLCPRDTVIRNSWARWLAAVNCRGEAETVFKTLIAERPTSFQPKYGYGRLLLDEERYDEATNQFREVLRLHRGHAMAHDGLAMALHGLARHAEGLPDALEAEGIFTAAEREFKSAIYWAGVAQDAQAMFFTHLGWFYVERKRWADALGAFDQAANEDPEYFGNYWGKGRALAGLEQWRNAAHALRKALEKAPDTLGPPASDAIPQLIQECETALTSDRREVRVAS
jgi:tetratricopeptide (TPR) repeat protein/energy-coupling factor transporter ATP-binding protein EcfA2